MSELHEPPLRVHLIGGPYHGSDVNLDDRDKPIMVARPKRFPTAYYRDLDGSHYVAPDRGTESGAYSRGGQIRVPASHEFVTLYVWNGWDVAPDRGTESFRAMSNPAEEAYAMFDRASDGLAAAEDEVQHFHILRELAIKAAHKNGESYADIAKRTGLSRARVAQLVKS